jgi:aldehyde:ferredoxin oxidoreductase
VENYVNLFAGTTGREVTKEDLISMSESVYNFQRVFNIRMGGGLRQDDTCPYRAMGPVTQEEYESRAERYDKQLQELVGIDPQGMSTVEKMAALRAYREDQYEKLVDAVYERRGWTPQGVPTLETLKRLKIDLPEVVEVVKSHLS